VAVTSKILHTKPVPADSVGHRITEKGGLLRGRPHPSTLAAARLFLDGLSLSGAVALAFPLRFRWHLLEATSAPLDLTAHLVAALTWLVAMLRALASHRLYDEDTLAPGGQEMNRIGRSLLQGVALVSTAVFLLRFVTVSRGWFLLVVALSAALLVGQRRLVRALLERSWARGRLRRPAILVSKGGAPQPSSADPGFGEFDIVATARPDDLAELLSPGPSPSNGRRPSPVVIVDGDTALAADDLWRLVISAGDAGSPVFVRSPFRALPADRLTTRTLDERTIVKVSPPALTGIRRLEKRLLDVAAALTLLALLAVPMALVACGVLLTSGWPVLYRQQRVGKDGRLFSLWKFRTMRIDAEKESGPRWATPGDPRRTPLGRVLRRFSLDELPQLWNVVRGDMSIVGPRPERPLFVARFSDGNPWYRFRHRIRPGITGLAQVRGLRGNTPLEPRVESDNWYIEHWSLWLDVRIAARTIVAVLAGRNAH
jgi:exopolysaccharide biosynthesis polyprenyl glycosylphosphotransferase